MWSTCVCVVNGLLHANHQYAPFKKLAKKGADLCQLPSGR